MFCTDLQNLAPTKLIPKTLLYPKKFKQKFNTSNLQKPVFCECLFFTKKNEKKNT